MNKRKLIDLTNEEQEDINNVISKNDHDDHDDDDSSGDSNNQDWDKRGKLNTIADIRCMNMTRSPLDVLKFMILYQAKHYENEIQKQKTLIEKSNLIICKSSNLYVSWKVENNVISKNDHHDSSSSSSSSSTSTSSDSNNQDSNKRAKLNTDIRYIDMTKAPVWALKFIIFYQAKHHQNEIKEEKALIKKSDFVLCKFSKHYVSSGFANKKCKKCKNKMCKGCKDDHLCIKICGDCRCARETKHFVFCDGCTKFQSCSYCVRGCEEHDSCIIEERQFCKEECYDDHFSLY